MESSSEASPVQIIGFPTETALRHLRALLSCGYQGVRLVPLDGFGDRYRLRLPLPHAPGVSVSLNWEEDVRIALAERGYLPIGSVSPGSRSRWQRADTIGQSHLPGVR